MELIIASNNKFKIKEIRELLGTRFTRVLSLSEAGIEHETVEDGQTFLENAAKKATEIAALSGKAAIADDSGLCVDALGGAPGIYSARYAGEHGNDKKNNDALLEAMRGVSDRRAHYTCAVVLAYPDGRVVSSEGYFYGTLLEEPSGDGGFGYDPLFLPDGSDYSLAHFTPEEKNLVSHRSLALRGLLEKIKNI